jgi:uncharacterized membrane protein YqjE
VRNLFAHSLELLQTRIELLATELEEETVRLIGLLAYGAAAFFLLGAGILFLAIFLTVLFWEDHRLLTLGILTLIFLAGGSVASFFALQTARARRRPFAASLAELAEDSVNLQARE